MRVLLSLAALSLCMPSWSATSDTEPVDSAPQAGTRAKLTRPADPKDYYPGSPVVQACVGPTGELLREPSIIESSGFRDIDAAAVKVAKATRYAAGKVNETPLPESCIKFKIKFELNVP